MGTLHAQNPSLWVGTTPETAVPRLGEDVTVDVQPDPRHYLAQAMVAPAETSIIRLPRNHIR